MQLGPKTTGGGQSDSKKEKGGHVKTVAKSTVVDARNQFDVTTAVRWGT